MSGTRRRVLGTLFLAGLVIVWQLLAVLIGKSYLLPSPVSVLVYLWENKTELFTVHLPATMQVVAIGGLLEILTGFVLALLMDASVRIERTLYPLMTITQTVPVMCIAPVFVLWFGYTVTMRVIVVILVNFFTIAVNVFDGLKAADVRKIELMKSWGASKRQILWHLKLPTALPYFFTALQISIPWSVGGAAVSEWLGAPAGLGSYSRSCMMSLDTAGLLAPLVILSMTALLLSGLLKLIQRRIQRG